MANYGRTALSEEQYEAAMRKVVGYLRNEERITNRALRALTGLNYDQSIKFFNLAVARGLLVRQGRASGVHYVQPQKE